MPATTEVTITYTPCDSSQVSAFGYDARTETMGIKFRSGGGSTYHYTGVPAKVFESLQAEAANPAGSVGKWVGAQLRGKFAYAKQPDQPGGVVFGLQLAQEPKYTTATATGRLINRSTGKPIPDDEPVFVLRAQDAHAIAALEFYRQLCSQADHQAVIKSRIADFARFATAKPERMKEPTSNLSELAGADWSGTAYKAPAPATVAHTA